MASHYLLLMSDKVEKTASPSASKSKSGKKRFEVKKWNAVALWAWDIVVDYCAICRNHIMDLCLYFFFFVCFMG